MTSTDSTIAVAMIQHLVRTRQADGGEYRVQRKHHVDERNLDHDRDDIAVQARARRGLGALDGGMDLGDALRQQHQATRPENQVVRREPDA